MKSFNKVLGIGIFASTFVASLSIANTQPASAQKQTCVITEDGSTVCGKRAPQIKKPDRSAVQNRDIKNYTISLKGCTRQDISVKCSLTVKNTGTERRFSISPVNSSLVDAKGRAYKGEQISIGGKTDVYSLLTISPGIEYAAEITFENIPAQISGVPIINIYTNAGKVQFRNVSL